MLQRLLSHPSFAKYSKNLAWTYVGQLAAGVLTLVVSIFMAHTLDKNTYGSYKYILSLLALASAFSLTGLRVSVNRAAALFYKHTIATASKLYIRYISITVIIVLAIGLYYLYAGNIIFGSTVLLAGALSILTGKYSFYPMYLNGVGQFKTTTLYTFYGDVVTSATLLAVILLFPSIPALVIGYYVASFAVAYVFQKRVANALESHVSEPERDAEILSQAKHQSVANVFSLFVSQIDKLIVFQYIGAIELAIYSFAIAVPDFIKSFVKLISTLFFPALTHGTTTKKITRVVTATIGVSFIVGIVAVASYVFLAPYLFKFLFPQYELSVFPSIVYSLVIILTAVSAPINTYFAARIKNGLMHHNNFASSAIQLVALVVGMFLSPTVLSIIIARLVGQAGSIIYISLVLYLKYRQSIFQPK